MKLFRRYNRINILVMGIVFLLFSVSFFFVLNHILVREVDNDLIAVKNKLAAYTEQTHHVYLDPQLDGVEITYLPATQQNTPTNFQLVEEYDPVEKRMNNYRRLVYSLQVGEDKYRVRLSVDLERRNSLSRIIAIITILGIFIIITAILISNHFILSRLWQPFYDAMAVMKNFRLGSGQKIEFPETNIDEFSFMIRSLELSTKKAIEEYYLLKQFTENASHELQTPVAIIRSKLDLLIQDEELSEKQSIIIKTAYSALKKLARLNQSLLLLAKIENKQFGTKENIDLAAMLTEKLSQFQELLEANNIGISTAFRVNCRLSINPELADILVNNLLSNAIRHNIPGGNIDIELDKNHLKISNTGQLYPLDEERLFNRFYKESQQGQGIGLGLFITHQICEISGIKIRYEYARKHHIFDLSW